MKKNFFIVLGKLIITLAVLILMALGIRSFFKPLESGLKPKSADFARNYIGILSNIDTKNLEGIQKYFMPEDFEKLINVFLDNKTFLNEKKESQYLIKNVIIVEESLKTQKIKVIGNVFVKTDSTTNKLKMYDTELTINWIKDIRGKIFDYWIINNFDFKYEETNERGVK